MRLLKRPGEVRHAWTGQESRVSVVGGGTSPSGSKDIGATAVLRGLNQSCQALFLFVFCRRKADGSDEQENESDGSFREGKKVSSPDSEHGCIC